MCVLVSAAEWGLHPFTHPRSDCSGETSLRVTSRPGRDSGNYRGSLTCVVFVVPLQYLDGLYFAGFVLKSSVKCVKTGHVTGLGYTDSPAAESPSPRRSVTSSALTVHGYCPEPVPLPPRTAADTAGGPSLPPTPDHIPFRLMLSLAFFPSLAHPVKQ